LAKLKVATVAVLAACLLGAGTTSLTVLPPAANTANPPSRQSAQSAEERSDVADTKEASPVQPENRALPPNTVCKKDAMQRLRDLVEQ
jgi:hypothetical protein